MNKCFILMMVACLLPFDSNAYWYTGINLGVNSVEVEKDLLYPIADPEPTSASFNSSYTGFHGQLLAGYDFSFSDRISTALEANADVFTGQAQHRINHWFLTNNAGAQEQLEYGVSLFLLPSYQLNQATRLFIGPGIARSRLVTNSGGNTGGNVGVTGSFNQWVTGGAVKAGIAAKMNEYTELLFSYQYTQYNSLTRMGMEPLSEELLAASYKPNVSTVMIGLRGSIPELKK